MLDNRVVGMTVNLGAGPVPVSKRISPTLAPSHMSFSSASETRLQDGSYTKEEYMDLARHQSFREDIEKAWRWHGAMLETFRQTPPHAGAPSLEAFGKSPVRR